jgi:hypothetical protein
VRAADGCNPPLAGHSPEASLAALSLRRVSGNHDKPVQDRIGHLLLAMIGDEVVLEV